MPVFDWFPPMREQAAGRNQACLQRLTLARGLLQLKEHARQWQALPTTVVQIYQKTHGKSTRVAGDGARVVLMGGLGDVMVVVVREAGRESRWHSLIAVAGDELGSGAAGAGMWRGCARL